MSISWAITRCRYSKISNLFPPRRMRIQWLFIRNELLCISLLIPCRAIARYALSARAIHKSLMHVDSTATSYTLVSNPRTVGIDPRMPKCAERHPGYQVDGERRRTTYRFSGSIRVSLPRAKFSWGRELSPIMSSSITHSAVALRSVVHERLVMRTGEFRHSIGAAVSPRLHGQYGWLVNPHQWNTL